MNCFIEQLPQDAKSPTLLSRAPGIVDWATIGTGPIYAAIQAFGYLYVVSGTKLYQVDSSGTGTLLGDIGAVSSNGVDIDRNTFAIVVVNQPDAYYYDSSTSTFGQITDADFTARGASAVEFLDNYLLFLEPDSGRFFGADLNSATSFDALNFATAEAVPDNLIGMKVDHRQVALFGEESVEIWENTGIAGFPFERAINGFVELGCFNGKSIAKLDQSLVWLANDYTVRRLDGVTPVRISHHGIEQLIQSSTISTANAFSYTQGGHLFYVLSFNEVTVVYDATTQLWHERKSYGYNNWLPSCHASVFGYELVGSSQSGAIGKLDKSTYTEWDTTQIMQWTYQPIYAEGKRAVHDRIEMELEVGVGLTTGQGSDPEMFLEYSDDNGQTYAFLPNKKIGPIGQYRKRVYWQRCGSSRGRVYRAGVSDPVRVNVWDTQIDVRGGRV